MSINQVISSLPLDKDAILSMSAEEVNAKKEDEPEKGRTMLMIAAKDLTQTGVENLKTLLSHPDIDVNQYEKYGYSALHFASMVGNKDGVESLLGHKDIDINNENGMRQTPLMLAVDKNQTEIVMMLLDHPEIDLFVNDIHFKRAIDYTNTDELYYLLWGKMNPSEDIEYKEDGEEDEEDVHPLISRLAGDDHCTSKKEYDLSKAHISNTQCFNAIEMEEYEIKDYLNAVDIEDEDDRKEEKGYRLVFFAGEDITNLTPHCYHLDYFRNIDDTSFYSTDCTFDEGYVYNNPLVALRFSSLYHVYLKDLVDALDTGKRVFVLLPCEDPSYIEKTVSLDVIETMEGMSASHCQEGSGKKVYAIYVCQGTAENPIAPIEYRKSKKSVKSRSRRPRSRKNRRKVKSRSRVSRRPRSRKNRRKVKSRSRV
jgi:hypothetical protein